MGFRWNSSLQSDKKKEHISYEMRSIAFSNKSRASKWRYFRLLLSALDIGDVDQTYVMDSASNFQWIGFTLISCRYLLICDSRLKVVPSICSSWWSKSWTISLWFPIWRFPERGVPISSSVEMGFWIISHPFCGTPISGNPYMPVCLKLRGSKSGQRIICIRLCFPELLEFTETFWE